MKDLIVSTAQFQTQSGDKEYNLSRIEALTARASGEGANVVSFHELSVTSYTFLKDLSREELSELAEEIPEGKSTQRLIHLAGSYSTAILTGLVEKEGDRLYNSYICVTGEGVVAKFRKLHPFINQNLSAGNEYAVFDLHGWKCGILVCYDNNVIENVRATVLLGADLVFMPHVTGCTPSAMPGRGWVDRALWDNRSRDPDSIRKEFDGPKGRGWLMRWLPARAYDNGIYVVFSNPIGPDGDQLKNGNSMILDPYGEVLAECTGLGDEVVTTTCTEGKLKLAGGYRYRRARRPELYGKIIGKENESLTRVDWMDKKST